MRPSPALGEDTDRVLAQVGYDKTAIMALRALGVVG
jgi:crotonobetainyl-CoA:carnitine CoA-transferase CaiB-like acyl-CoA transferase